MQSSLTITAAHLNRLLLSGGPKQQLAQRLGCATTSGRPADPAVHAVDPDEVYPTEAIQDEKLRHLPPEHEPRKDDSDPYVPPETPISSAPKIKSTGVVPLTDPVAQQKRRISASTVRIEDVSCGAIDVSPWPEDGRETDSRKQREEQHEDDVEYFKHHKASPLSEIEIADTRKPITRATDGTAQNDSVGNEGTGVLLWRPEQLDSAEDSLYRATEIFKWNAMRGDPDSPHGRVLRKLRREYW
ncbi:hypothetical protein OROGR_024872 [Orobanche gracilis]